MRDALFLLQDPSRVEDGKVVIKETRFGLGELPEQMLRLTLMVKVPEASAKPTLPLVIAEKYFNLHDSNKPLSNLKLLLADDAPELRILLSNFLLHAGASVTLDKDGKEAVERALSDNFDAVIMDIQMPRLDGYNALRILKEKSYPKPVIALTAHAMIGERDRCLAAGFCDYVTKPVRFQLLVDAVLSSSEKFHQPH